MGHALVPPVFDDMIGRIVARAEEKKPEELHAVLVETCKTGRKEEPSLLPYPLGGRPSAAPHVGGKEKAVFGKASLGPHKIPRADRVVRAEHADRPGSGGMHAMPGLDA